MAGIACLPRLVHCHMTSNNETVPAKRQTPWAGNYDVKREAVHCYPRKLSLFCCCTWISARFWKFLLYNKSLYDWSLGEQLTRNDWCFLRFSMIPQTKSGNKTLKSRAIAVNISRVTVNCFPSDVTVFAMLPEWSPECRASHNLSVLSDAIELGALFQSMYGLEWTTTTTTTLTLFLQFLKGQEQEQDEEKGFFVF